MSEPINIISLGAGVQSSTMALMAAAGEITPMPACAIFADTRAEPPEVYEWLGWLSKRLPFPVVTVSKGDLAQSALRVRVSKKTGFSYLKHLVPVFVVRSNGKTGMMQRQCTLDFKIALIQREARKLLGKNGRGIMWIGISTDEISRMKPSNKSWLENMHPLIDKFISRNDCYKWMAKKGYPEPPRSACEFCPYHSDAQWIHLKANQPESFARAVQFERDYQSSFSKVQRLDGIPFLHNSRVPLDKVKFEVSRQKEPDLFNNECEGMCGV